MGHWRREQVYTVGVSNRQLAGSCPFDSARRSLDDLEEWDGTGVGERRGRGCLYTYS